MTYRVHVLGWNNADLLTCARRRDVDRRDAGRRAGAGAHAAASVGRRRLPVHHQQRGRQHDTARAATVQGILRHASILVLTESQRSVVIDICTQRV